MADIGKAGLLIVPRFNGLTEAVNKALKEAQGKAEKPAEGIGERAASGFGKGLGKSGAVIGAFSTLTARAMDAVSSSVGSATDRFDTLNNYPRVMQSLGYSAKDAESSINLMSDRLSVLPTRLDDMVSTVQGLSVITGDLSLATDAGLALNDMLLASGSSTQLTTAAMEQFRQMLSKGKPEMEDWKSLTAAMPGQLDQLAKSMLGPTANANDLYAALGGGKNEATISMDQLLNEIVRLDEEGGAGFESFRAQAETATGGVATSAANTANAIVKGLAGTMEAVGSANISGVMGDVKGAINDVFGVVNGAVSGAMPVISGLYDRVKESVPTVLAMAGGYVAASKAVDGATAAIGLLKGGMSPTTAIIGGATAAIGFLASAAMNASEHQEDLRKATVGINDAVGRAAALDDYRWRVDVIGESAETAAMSIGDLVGSMAGHVDAMNESSESAEAEIAKLTTAQSVLSQYNGVTDLSTEAAGRLEWALGVVNEQFGLSISAADVAAGSYKDAEGATKDLSTEIDNLVEAKKREIQAEALATQLSEAYEMRSEAAATYAKERSQAMQEQQSLYESLVSQGVPAEDAMKLAQESTNQSIAQSKQLYDEACAGVDALESEMGAASAATSESADAYDRWAATLTGSAFAATVKAKGGIEKFAGTMRTLGVDTEKLSSLSEDELLALADAYDGSASSVVMALDEMGVAMDESASAAAKASADMKSSIKGMGSGLTDALASAGVDLSAFSDKLVAAGVSTETLNQVGSDNLASLAQACGGDVDMMIWYIQNYNSTPILDKDGKVQVDQAQLIDAQGNVWTWNGTTLVDKDGNAAVEDIRLTDAQGNLWTWNGSELVDKDGNAIVDGNLRSANGDIQTWNDYGDDLGTKTGHVNIFTKIVEGVSSLFSGNAAGGIRTHADGGVRLHASGAIATKAVPLDIVGEDGAEAIVPLTNRRYSQPFADIIADGVAKRSGDAELVKAVRVLHRDLMAIYGAIPEERSSRDRARDVRKAVAYGI